MEIQDSGERYKAIHAMRDQAVSQVYSAREKTVNMDALASLNTNKEGTLLLAKDSKDLSITTTYTAKLSNKYLLLYNPQSGDREMEFTLAAIKMPIVNVPSTNSCFRFHYKASDGPQMEEYAFCTKSAEERKQWMMAIMANRFLENSPAAGTESDSGEGEEESDGLPPTSTKEDRLKRIQQNQIDKLTKMTSASASKPVAATVPKHINVEIKQKDDKGGKQLFINGQEVEWSS